MDDYILADEMTNDVHYESDEGTEQQPNDTTIHMHKKQDGKNFNAFALI